MKALRWMVALLLLPCGVTRAERESKPCAGATISPGVSANKKYKIDVGPAGMMLTERELVWSERDGRGAYQEKFTWSNLRMPLKRPYHASLFIPPTGNGFLMFTPYPDNPFFAFYTLEGTPVATYEVKDILNPEEIDQKSKDWGRCRAQGACSTNDYRLAEDPKLSDDGECVEFKAFGTNRRILLFLPLGRLVTESLGQNLLETLRTPLRLRAEDQSSIDEWIKDLDHEDVARRDRATAALKAKGFLAMESLEMALNHSKSKEVLARIKQILSSLAPLDRVPRDLPLLASLLSYPNEGVAKAARERLHMLVKVEGNRESAADIQAWIEQAGDRFRWDERSQVYRLQ